MLYRLKSALVIVRVCENPIGTLFAFVKKKMYTDDLGAVLLVVLVTVIISKD